MIVNLLVSPDCMHIQRVESVASLVNGCQRHYRLEVVRDDDLKKTSEQIEPAALVTKLEAKYSDRSFIAVTEDQFDDNWFSHEYRTSAVITVFDWESLYAPPH